MQGIFTYGGAPLVLVQVGTVPSEAGACQGLPDDLRPPRLVVLSCERQREREIGHHTSDYDFRQRLRAFIEVWDELFGKENM